MLALTLVRQRAQDERREFGHMLAVGPIIRAIKMFLGRTGELLELEEKQRRIERSTFGVLRGAGDHESLARAGASDVRVESFVPNLLMRPGAEPDIFTREQI